MTASGDNPKWGFIDKTGTVVIPMQYAHTNRFSEGLCMVVEFDEAGNQRCGYIDKTGTVVIPRSSSRPPTSLEASLRWGTCRRRATSTRPAR